MLCFVEWVRGLHCVKKKKKITIDRTGIYHIRLLIRCTILSMRSRFQDAEYLVKN